MVSKMGPRVSKMVKAGFKVIQDNPRQYQGLVAFNFVTSWKNAQTSWVWKHVKGENIFWLIATAEWSESSSFACLKTDTSFFRALIGVTTWLLRECGWSKNDFEEYILNARFWKIQFCFKTFKNVFRFLLQLIAIMYSTISFSDQPSFLLILVAPSSCMLHQRVS